MKQERLQICLLMQGGLGWIAGAEYIKNIAIALGSLPPEVRSTFNLLLLCSKTTNEDIQKQVKPYLDELLYEEDCLESATLLNRIWWKGLQKLSGQFSPRLDRFLKARSIDFVYPYLSSNSKNQPYRSAECIFDLQHKYLTHFFSADELLGRDAWFSKVAAQASTIVVNSQSAAADLHKFFPASVGKTKVLRFKTVPISKWLDGNPERTQQEYCLPAKFFLISNQFWQHKNHLLVFQALALLKQKAIYPVVVCTGHIYDNRKPDYSDIILQSIHKLGIAQQVYLLGLVPKFDQVQLMRRASAIIQPSLFEGWSTLVEDARLFGKSIILSNLPVHIEQNPPNNTFFESESPEHLAQLMEDWWEKSCPGPDLQQEEISIATAHLEVREFGYRFLEIAKSSIEVE
jgi:glycosyltransferase involved in cell wall biosynthesis